MIQGLRLLPFTADLPIFDCTKCVNGDKTMNLQPQPQTVRQIQGCPFLPRHANPRPAFGVPDGSGIDPADVEECPGYLTSLPEVQEVVRDRPQWLKGTLAIHWRGSDVNEDLTHALNAQAILDGAVTTRQNVETEKRAKEAEARRG